MSNQDCLDLLASIRSQRCLNLVCRGAIPPGAVDHLNLQPMTLAKINPSMTENTISSHENLVSRAQGVGDGGFPTPGTTCREEQYAGAIGSKNLFYTCLNRQHQINEIRRPVITCLDVHRLLQPVGNVGGTGNE